MCVQKTPNFHLSEQFRLTVDEQLLNTEYWLGALPHWDPGSPSSRVPAFLLARSKINLLRLAVASGARG
jgi:hypothetical protein